MRFKIWNSLGFLLLILAVTVIQAEDPIYQCVVEDTQDECLERALDIIFVVKYDGPPVDPFSIKKIALFSNDTKKGISVKADMENVIVKGPSKAKFLSARFNRRKNKVIALLHIPKLILEFDYRVQVEVFELDRHDKGHMEIENMVMTMEADLDPLYNPRTSSDFVKQVKFNIREVLNFYVKLNRFDDENDVEENTDELLNKEYYQAWRPAIERIFGAIVTGRFKKIFKNVPVKFI